MIIAEPKVKLIAHTMPVDGFQTKYIGTDLETFVVALARSTRTTEDLDKIYLETLEGVTTEKHIKQYMIMKHFTVFEFLDFTFEIKGISRACSHELVRHRTATYLQQSQRHVDLRDRGVVVPNSFENDDRAFYTMNETDKLWRANYVYMVDTLKIPKEDARFLAPNAIETRVIMKIDGRNLLHFLKLRTDESAQWEIRHIAKMMWFEAQKVCLNIFGIEHMDKWV